MKKIKLDKFEKELEIDAANGKFKRVNVNPEEYREMAKNTLEILNKERINLRIDPAVREKFQLQADADGIPYQTLINSVLKKYVDGKLVDSSIKKMMDELKKEIKALKKRAS